ncbi:hypothetical protein [Psychrobacillus sp. BM2]|uniref:hypothetical protein n=1 Tax=Psychrobacillus sp. BM2 TaxID=3400421 RepID=UPI003B0105A3
MNDWTLFLSLLALTYRILASISGLLAVMNDLLALILHLLAINCLLLAVWIIFPINFSFPSTKKAILQ